MMDHSLIREQIRSLASDHLPRNSKQFRFHIYDDKRYAPARGYVIDPKPFKGKVIAVDDTAIFVKTARTEFAAIEKSLTNQSVTVGSMVLVTPYARRRFDGKRADEAKDEVHQNPDGTTYVRSTWVLGDVTVQIPLPKARSEQLARLIQHLEKLPAPDGFRNISHLLVDARAYGFSCIDPENGDITGTPPTISFRLNNSKFSGVLKILCEAMSAEYTIEVHRDGLPVSRIGSLQASGLGKALEDLIDDGGWRRIQVDVLPAKK